MQAALALLALVSFSFVFGPATQFSRSHSKASRIRIAYLPNLTHAPALISIGDRRLEKILPRFAIEPTVVNAGPDAMEALLSGAIDVAYVGPSPALNTYVRSGGSALRILAGVCEGGAALICRRDLNIHSVGDLNGYRVAVPEFGGTQDVSLRHFMKEAGLRPREQGGSVEILPIKNPEILSLFKQKQIDAAWVPEPWASRLQIEAGGKTVAQEEALWPNHRFVTTVLVASEKFIVERPEATAALIDENARCIGWIRAHPAEAKLVANREISRITGKPLNPTVLDQAWAHLHFSSEQNQGSIVAFAAAAKEAGYLKAAQTIDSRIWFPSRLAKTRQIVSGTTR